MKGYGSRAQWMKMEVVVVVGVGGGGEGECNAQTLCDVWTRKWVVVVVGYIERNCGDVNKCKK